MSVDDAGQSAARLNALIQASQGQGGSGSAPILLGFKLEVDMASPFTCKGKGLNSDAMIMRAAQRQPGIIGSLLKQLGCTSNDIMEGMKKVAQAGAVTSTSIDQITGPSLPGGFVAGLGRSDGGGGMDVG